MVANAKEFVPLAFSLGLTLVLSLMRPFGSACSIKRAKPEQMPNIGLKDTPKSVSIENLTDCNRRVQQSFLRDLRAARVDTMGANLTVDAIASLSSTRWRVIDDRRFRFSLMADRKQLTC